MSCYEQQHYTYNCISEKLLQIAVLKKIDNFWWPWEVTRVEPFKKWKLDQTQVESMTEVITTLKIAIVNDRVGPMNSINST